MVKFGALTDTQLKITSKQDVMDSRPCCLAFGAPLDVFV